jgi:hypothetical protein
MKGKTDEEKSRARETLQYRVSIRGELPLNVVDRISELHANAIRNRDTILTDKQELLPPHTAVVNEPRDSRQFAEEWSG